MAGEAIGRELRRARRSATVMATGARVYLGYKRAQKRIAALPEAERAAAWDHQHEIAATHIYRTARTLRGLYTKAAQFLGARADLLPEPYIRVLSQLHDRVPPQPYRVMRPVLRRELGAEPESVFARFERRPVAAASLAQVHRATLKDGREVAVKVQYPDIGRLIDLDMRNLSTLFWLVRRFEGTLDLQPIVRAIGRLVPGELDFVNEARSSEEIGRTLAAHDDVVVPAVVWEHSSARVLVTQWVDGTRISDVERLRALRLDGRALAARVVDLWGEQVMGTGFFHGDPHPGNILVLPDGRLALIDFGLTGRMSPETLDRARALCRAAAERNGLSVIAAFQALGYLAQGDDFSSYATLGSRVLGPGAYADQDVEGANARVARMLRGFDLERVAPESLLMMRVLGLLKGLTSLLGYHRPVLAAWRPYADATPEPARAAGD